MELAIGSLGGAGAPIDVGSCIGWSDTQIMQAFGVGETTLWRGRRRFLEQGLDDALHRRPQPERP